MMAALVERHPGLEIESCCGGGGRVDLGVMEHASRVWVSDCIDAHERHRMVRWTGLTLPPELMGTHVGSDSDHTTGRWHTLSFRAGTAMWGHLGIEWDLTTISDGDRAELSDWIALHKRFRELLHTGRVVHADHPDGGLDVEGVLARSGEEALFRVSALEHTLGRPAGRITLPGLESETRYRITALPPALSVFENLPPRWYVEGIVLSGRTLGEVGLVAPMLKVDELVVLHAEAVKAR
jgi:alpha-galactosidase